MRTGSATAESRDADTRCFTSTGCLCVVTSEMRRGLAQPVTGAPLVLRRSTRLSAAWPEVLICLVTSRPSVTLAASVPAALASLKPAAGLTLTGGLTLPPFPPLAGLMSAGGVVAVVVPVAAAARPLAVAAAKDARGGPRFEDQQLCCGSAALSSESESVAVAHLRCE